MRRASIAPQYLPAAAAGDGLRDSLLASLPRARLYAFDPWTKVPVALFHEPEGGLREAGRKSLPRLRWCWAVHSLSW